jgi:hypothetical protein
MGAGEQRVFEIFTQVFSMRRYGLVLVDEIDLLLHSDALDRLLEVLSRVAAEKNLQIIFTTHRESVLASPHVSEVRHLQSLPDRTIVLDRSTPDAIRRLTGKAAAAIEIFVEDDVAEAIVRRVAMGLGAVRHVRTTKIGSGDNGFSALCGLILRGQGLESVRFILDGDTYLTADSRQARANQVLTGNHPRDAERRLSLLGAVSSLHSVEGRCPEQMLRDMIALQDRPSSLEASEIWDIAQEVTVVEDKHHFVNRIVGVLGMDRASALTHIVSIASQTERWPLYVAEVHAWLEARLASVG